MIDGKKIFVLIPARGGSKGIPGKNIKLLCGKPLISYNINAAKKSKYLDGVYVSTDDKEIAEISKSCGADVIERPAEYATDGASSELALLHFAEAYDFDLLVFLQCTSPLTTEADIDGAIEKYSSGGYDSLLSVCKDRGGFLCGGFTWGEAGRSLNYNYENRKRRQDFGETYRENGAIYIMSKKGLLSHKNRLYGKIGLYVMPGARSFEIDEPEDWNFLEKIYPLIKDEK
ncbi:MAG: acylneuraminate cytidylyltransferase family protein [Patescibacteria group bacterium]